MMRSLTSAVAGLRTHQTKMDVIGNNIANVNTYGFKASRATFNDVYYQTMKAGRTGNDERGGVNPTQIGYGSQLSTIDVIVSNGGGSYTGRPTDVYIDGDGFFTTRDAEGNLFYTRLGNLTVDGDFLVDYAGNFIMGIPLNSHSTGEVVNPMVSGYWSEGDLMPIEFGTAILVSDKQVNITEPAYEKLTDANGHIMYDQNGDPIYTTDPPTRLLNAEGQEYEEPKLRLTGHTLKVDSAEEIKYAKMTSDGLAVAPDGSNLMYYPNGQPVYADATAADFDGTDPATWVALPQDADPSKRHPVNLISGSEATGDAVYEMEPIVRLEGGKETKEFETVETGRESKSVLDCITSISIGTDGSITGITTGRVEYNGESIGKNKVIYLGNIAIATFPNQNGLNQVGMSYFDASANSGDARYTTPTANSSGQTKAGYLEMANVEISQEFTDMITTQRGFQANTRIVTVSDEMLQELVNLKR